MTNKKSINLTYEEILNSSISLSNNLFDEEETENNEVKINNSLTKEQIDILTRR